MFDLMNLPPELRIRIYKYALVRDVIRIVQTRLSFSHYSYGIQPSSSPPLVNIFLINRQVYFEAWPIFYEQNAFAFAVPSCTMGTSEICLKFLYDRPHHALRHIREIHLLVGNNPRFPIRVTLMLEQWQILLDEINRYLSIRVLVLYIRGRTDDALEWLYFVDYPWRDWLYKMNGLQKLDIEIAGTSTHEAHLALAKQMRSKMVLGGEQLGIEGITLGQRSLKRYEGTIDEPVNSISSSADILDLEESY